MQIRQFKKAAELFIDSIATFNKDAMISFKELVFYTVLTGMLSLDRATIKQKIMLSSDVLQVIREIGSLKPFLESFYKCNYKRFMIEFVNIIEQVK